MEAASKKAYIPKAQISNFCYARANPSSLSSTEIAKQDKQEEQRHEDDPDANVFELNLSCLEESAVIATGDPFFCPSCGAIFNIHSKNYLAKEALGTFWACEFCNTKTQLHLDEAEYPQNGTLTYILAAAASGAPAGPPGKEEVKAGSTPMVIGDKPAAASSADEDTTVIFCIDVSGSMDASKRIPTKDKLKYQKRAGTTTRLEALKIAIDSQIQKLAKESPNKKIGFVTFESSVELMGDGSQAVATFGPEQCNGPFYNLVELSVNYHKTHMNKRISETKTELLQKLAGIKTGGGTALGAGLVISAGLASKGKPGSMVVICTDGLANEGLGAINTTNPKQAAQVKEFYTQVGEYAQQHGIIVSIISLVESECRLDLLSPIANLTAGNILRIDPHTLSTDFSAFMSEKIIATSVQAKIKIHKALQFRNAQEHFLSADKSVYTQSIGNVTKDTVVTFEYALKPVSELLKHQDIDLAKQKNFPFQAQVEYKALDGKKCIRVITQTLSVTDEIEEARKEVNADVIQVHAVRGTAQYADAGHYDRALKNASKWGSLNKAPKDSKKYEQNMAGLSNAIKQQKHYSKAGMSNNNDELTIQVNLAMNQRQQMYVQQPVSLPQIMEEAPVKGPAQPKKTKATGSMNKKQQKGPANPIKQHPIQMQQQLPSEAKKEEKKCTMI